MGRDARIDTLRGFALVVITTTHAPFAWRMLAADSLGHSGFAQVFFFLSGLVGGLVYTRLASRATDREIWKKTLRRVRLIWLAHVGTCVLLLASVHLARTFGSGWTPVGGELLLDRPGRGLVLGALGVYLPGFTDVLPVYVFLALTMPVVVLGILRGHGRLVLGVSALVWLTAQLGLEDRLVEWLGTKVAVRIPFFRVTGWQVVFVGGLALGVAWAQGKLDRVRVGAGLALILLAAHAVLFGFKHGLWPDGPVSRTVDALAFGRSHGLVLVVDFALVVGLTAFLARTVPRLFTSRWLALLGRHSLAVFGFHLAAMYALAMLEIERPAAQVGATLLAIASLTLPAWLAERRRTRPAAVVRMETPAADARRA